MAILASLHLTPGTQALTQAQAWLEQQAVLQHWPEHLYFALQLSLDEALNNILQHGFSAAPSATDDIKLVLHDLSPQHVMLEIIDNAPPFNPTCARIAQLATDVEISNVGGHGIRLMRHYLHNMEYAYLRGHNHLYLYASYA